jgi:hypothetical protein
VRLRVCEPVFILGVSTSEIKENRVVWLTLLEGASERLNKSRDTIYDIFCRMTIFGPVAGRLDSRTSVQPYHTKVTKLYHPVVISPRQSTLLPASIPAAGSSTATSTDR